MMDALTTQTLTFVAFLNLAGWIAALSFALVAWRLPFYHPALLYLVYHFLGFVMRPFLILANEGSFLWRRIGYSPEPGDLILIATLTNLSLLAFMMGFGYFARRRSVPLLQPIEFEIRRPALFAIVTIALIAGGFYANWKNVAGAGLNQVLAYATTFDAQGGRRLVGISGYITAMAEFIPIICVFLFLSKKLRKVAIVLIIAFIGIRLYAGAQRLSFVVVAAAVFMIMIIEQRRRYPKLLPVLAILLFALLFDIIGGDRYAARRLVMGTESVGNIVESYFTQRGNNALTSDIVEFDVATAATAAIFKHNDYSLGTQYVRLLIWPIPRQIWEDKPVYTSIVDLNDYGDFRYLTTSLYADAFMTLGFASAALIMFAWGAGFFWVYNFAGRTFNPVIYMFFWTFTMYVKTVLRDGGVTVVYFWIFSVVPIVAMVLAGNVKLCRKQ